MSRIRLVSIISIVALILLATAWTVLASPLSGTYQVRLDVNRDGIVDIVDIQQVAATWQEVAPDPIQPNQVNIIASRYYPFSSIDTMAGELRNDTAATARVDDVFFAYYDDTGKLVGSSNTTLGLPTSYIPPGGVVPFALWAFVGPTPFDYYDAGLNWTASCYTMQPLTVISETLTIYLGNYRLLGSVRNDSGVELSGATVYVGDYDAAGLVIDVGSDYCSTLANGALCDYDIQFDAAGYSYYTLQAYGRDGSSCTAAELSEIQNE